jgi:hypothetical protein
LNEQVELMHKNRTASALTDEDLKKWFNKITPSLIEFEGMAKAIAPERIGLVLKIKKL